VVLDLKQSSEQDLLHKLIETADVFVTNVTNPALIRLGLDYDSLKVKYPKLVYAQLTAWGRSGPGAERPGYDIGAWWAASGIMDFVRSDEDAPPPRYMAGMGDLTTSTQLLAGIMVGLYHKERTGKGQLVDACLLRSAMFVQGSMLTMASVAQTKAGRKGFNPDKISPTRANRNAVYNPANNSYQTKDGRFLMLMGVEMMRHLPKILPALGLPHLMSEIKDMMTSTKKRMAMIAAMDAAMATKTEAEWIPIFDAADVWYTRINKMEDMLNDEQAVACRAFVNVPGMDSKLLSSPILFSGGVDAPVARAPVLGANTEEILGPLRSKL